MILSIDVGGTKTLIALFSESGEVLKKEKIPTNHSIDQFFEELFALIEKEFLDAISAIGIGVPGVIDYDRGIALKFGNLPWTNVNFKARLEERFHVPVTVDNDANVAGYSEANILRPTPPLALYITISTGIGVGIIHNGKLEPTLGKSEAGHIVLLQDGKYRTWENIVSGQSILRDYGKYAHEISDDQTWKEIAHKIALGLLAVIPTLYPDVLIFGGSVGTYFEKFATFLREELERHLPPMIDMPTIVQAQHPEEAVIYGCYELAKNVPHPHTH
jgi:glucokinase